MAPIWRHVQWRCEHNLTYHCTSPRGGVATWRQKMANLKFPFAILAPHGATWRHKFAKMAPLWRQNGAIVAIQRTRHFMAPRGAKCSPRGATVAPRSAILAPLWRHVAPQSAHDLKYYTTKIPSGRLWAKNTLSVLLEVRNHQEP